MHNISEGKQFEMMTQQTIISTLIFQISKLSLNEYNQSYVKKIPIQMKGGVTMTQEYVMGFIHAYINAVDCLDDMVSPMYQEDKNDDDEKLIENQIANILKDEKTKVKDIKIKEDGHIIKQENRRKIFRLILKFLHRYNFWEEEEYVDKGQHGT